MAAETFRIEIPINVRDNTEPGVSQAMRKVNAFDRANQKTQERLEEMDRTKYQVVLNALDRASGIIGTVSAKARSIAGRTYSFTMKVVDLATAPLRAIWNFATSLQGVILGGGLTTVGFKGLQLSGEMDRAKKSIDFFTGSAEEGTKAFQELVNQAIKSPLYEVPFVVQTAGQLLAAGKNIEFVKRALKDFEQTAYYTGASLSQIKLAFYGFKQIASVGTLQMEELRQVTENLNLPLQWVIEELGLTGKATKNLGDAAIPANEAMEAILETMEKRFPAKDMQDDILALGSALKETGRMFLWAFGRGMSGPVMRIMQDLSAQLDPTGKKFNSFAGSLEYAGKVVGEKLEQIYKDVKEFLDKFNQGELKNMGLGDKIIYGIEYGLDEASKWLQGAGGKKVEKVFVEMAEIAGRAWMTALGATLEGAGNAVKEGDWGGAAALGGMALMLGAGTLLGIVGKGGKAAIAGVEGMWKAGKWLFGKGSKAADAKDVANAAKVADQVGGGASKTGIFSKIVGLLGKNGDDVLKAGSKAAGKGIKGIPVLGALLGLIASGAVVASAAQEDRGREAAGEAGSWLGAIGAGAGAGALVGTLGGGPIGTAVGGIVGGIGGAIGGEAFTEWLYDQKDAIASMGGKVKTAISEFGTKAGESISGFFTETIPNFVTEQIPYAIGYATGSIGKFFTVTLPQGWNDLWTAVGNFLTETIPAWANGAYNTAASFFTVSVPTFFTNLWNSVYGFFTETLPTWATGAFNKANEFFTQKVPEFFTDLWSSVSTFVTEKIPEYAKALKDSVTGWFGSFRDWASNIWDKVKSSFSAGYEAGSLSSGGSNVAKHAWGGIMTKPHMGIVAEAGPEAIIPLSGEKRQRGIELWQRTGELLGVRPYADGGIVGQAGTLNAVNTVVEVVSQVTDASKSMADLVKKVDVSKMFRPLGQTAKTIGKGINKIGFGAEAVFKRLPVIGAGMMIGSAALDIALAEDKKQAVVTNAGSILGSIAGGFAGGAALGATGGAIFGAPGAAIGGAIGGIAGGIGGAIGGEAFTEWVYGQKDKIEKAFGEAWENVVSGLTTSDRKGNILKHAYGGIMTKPHMGIVAEAGPEAIIPLSGEKRQRGIELWQRTGELLGVRPYADGGIVGEEPADIPTATPAGRGGQSISVKVEVSASPTFIIRGGGDADENKILAVLKAYIREMADDIGDELAERLARIFANMPVKGGARA